MGNSNSSSEDEAEKVPFSRLIRKTTSSFIVSPLNYQKRKTKLSNVFNLNKRKDSKKMKRSEKMEDLERRSEDGRDDRGSNMNWLQKERRFVTADRWTAILVQKKFQQIFDSLSQRIHNRMGKTPNNRASIRKEVSKHAMHRVWKEFFGHTIDLHLFDRLFDLMDADGNGFVDESEFTVVICFLLNKGSATNKTKLAYDLFDTNKDGKISKREFHEMLSTIMGSNLDILLAIPEGNVAFREFIQKEFTEELLTFYIEVKTLKAKYKDTKLIPLEVIKEIYEKYIVENSPLEINISYDQRDFIRGELEKANKMQQTELDMAILKDALQEVQEMLESGSLIRFKATLREPPFDLLAHPVWKNQGLKPDDELDFDTFEHWANKINGLFNFLDDLQEQFSDALLNATFSWAKSYNNNQSTDHMEGTESQFSLDNDE